MMLVTWRAGDIRWQGVIRLKIEPMGVANGFEWSKKVSEGAKDDF